MRRTKREGWVSWKESNSRMTLLTRSGLVSLDLGCITLGEAQKRAYINGVVLLVNGRRKVV